MDTFDHLGGELLTRLAWTSLQAALLVGLIALLLRLRPNLPATLRCALWWLVALQAVVGLAAPTPVELPWLAAPSQAAGHSINVSAPTSLVHVAPVPHRKEHASPAAASASRPDWPLALLLLWLAAVLVQMPLLFRDARRVRRLRDRASKPSDALRRLCENLSQTMQLSRAPAIEVVANIRSPQIVGLRQPTILWPLDSGLDEAEGAMAMAHELAHLKRGDLWLGWIPAMARRLFFFHPLIALAVREYALQREAACDAQVLQQRDVDPRAYGQLLLRLGVGRALPAGLAGASPTFGNLKRRLIMLQPNKPLTRVQTWLLIGAIAAVGVVPYRVTAAPDAVSAVRQGAAATKTPQAPPMPPMPPAAPPAPGVPPPPPPAPPALPAGLATLHNVDIEMGNHPERGFALVDGDSATIRGSGEDTAAVARLHKQNGDSFVWVRNGKQGYVIRDPSAVARAKSIQAPLTKLTHEQGELAGRVGEIAGQEAGMAAREAGFASEQAALAGQQAELASRVANGGDAQALAEVARQRQVLDARQKQIDARHAVLRNELSGQRNALSKQRSDLTTQMASLHERSKQLSMHSREAMDALVNEAIANGTAQAVPLR